MKFQLHIFIMVFLFLSCREPVNMDKIENNNDSIFSKALKEKITLKSFPENFFKLNGIDDWDSFERFQSSVEGMSKMNPKSLDVFLNGLSINIEKLEKGEFPERFNKPQILSRLKLLRMQALKAKYFTEYYTKDSIKPALIELYSYYNSLIERMITISKEDL